MGWGEGYTPAKEREAAAEAVKQVNAEAQFRHDLIAVLREIRDALHSGDKPQDEPDGDRRADDTPDDVPACDTRPDGCVEPNV